MPKLAPVMVSGTDTATPLPTPQSMTLPTDCRTAMDTIDGDA